MVAAVACAAAVAVAPGVGQRLSCGRYNYRPVTILSNVPFIRPSLSINPKPIIAQIASEESNNNNNNTKKKKKSKKVSIINNTSINTAASTSVVVSVAAEDVADVIPLEDTNTDDQVATNITDIDNSAQVLGGLAFEAGDIGIEGTASPSPSPPSHQLDSDLDKTLDRAINAAIVLAAGSFATTKLLTIDSDYWHGWTLYEILRYVPQHNWTAYEEALKANPVLAKMMISGVVYSLGDWIAQCYEGKPLFEFDRIRMFRSGLVGFTLHGSLSHYYYYFCEALFPSQDWWVVPAKVLFDQTVWAAIWNSIYFVVLGFLRFESPVNILSEWKATFWPMLTAGWKLWPFAHLITYGVVPVEQRLLWVDCVELVWVTILSTYSNEKSEARHLEAASDLDTRSPKE